MAPKAPAGQAYDLPTISFGPDFTNSSAGNGKINLYKTILNFTAEHAGSQLYMTWRATVKAQLSARNFTPQQALPNADFREIVHCMRRLRPACDVLVTAYAGNDVARILQIEEAIATLVKDCCSKLRYTLLAKGGMQGAAGIVAAEVQIAATLLPTGGPPQWGVNTPPVPAKQPAAPKVAPAA